SSRGLPPADASSARTAAPRRRRMNMRELRESSVWPCRNPLRAEQTKWGKAKRLRATAGGVFRRDAVGWPGRTPGSGQGSTGVNPRDSIDVRDDTGKAIGCHYELTAPERISQDVGSFGRACRDGWSRAGFCVG